MEMRNPPSPLVDCLLARPGCLPWHESAQLCQLSCTWRAAIRAWRHEQIGISITSLTSSAWWLDAWERPQFDAVSFRGLMRDTPKCTSVELLWWSLSRDVLAQINASGSEDGLGWPALSKLLLETCAVSANDLASLRPDACRRLEKLSLWTCYPSTLTSPLFL